MPSDKSFLRKRARVRPRFKEHCAGWFTTVHVTWGERTCCERGGLQAGLPIVPFCVPCIECGLGRRVGQTLLLLSRFCRPLWQRKTTTAGQLLIDWGAEPEHVIGADICFSCSRASHPSASGEQQDRPNSSTLGDIYRNLFLPLYCTCSSKKTQRQNDPAISSSGDQFGRDVL